MKKIPDSRRFVRLDQFGGVEQLQLRKEPLRLPGPGQLLVAVTACGVNFADTMVRRGEYRKDMRAPLVPGMEAAGRVAVAGPSCRFQEGDHVALFMEMGGAYADYVLVDESMAFRVHPDLPGNLVAASFLQGVTAWYAVHRYGRAKPGESVLVSGAAGGLGSWTVQLALDAGTSVVGLASTAAKREEVMAFGCSTVLDPADDDLSSRLRQARPGGFDVIVDGVGGPLFNRLLPSLARNGRYVVAGSATQQPATLDVRHLLPRGQAVVGFVVRNVMDLEPDEPTAALEAVLGRAASGKVNVAIREMAMSDVQEAHRLIEARAVVGKIVLNPSH